MREEITNEFIRYKSGFIAGKGDTVEAFKLGKIIKLDDAIEKEKIVDQWNLWGYQDGFLYFANLIDENNLDLEQINTSLLIKEHFVNRVIEFNQKSDKKVPIASFRL